MLLNNQTQDAIKEHKFNSFTEGFDFYDENTNILLSELIENLDKYNDTNLSLLSDITMESVNPNVTHRLNQLKTTSNNVFVSLAKWFNKFMSWVKSFVMQSTNWVNKNEKRLKQNAHKLDDPSKFKYSNVDIDEAISIFKHVEGTTHNLQALFSQVSSGNGLENVKLGEPISVKAITGFSSAKEMTSAIVSQKGEPNLDNMINNVHSVEKVLKNIVSLKNDMNKLKSNVDKFTDSIDPNASTETFKKAYAVNTYFRVSISSVVQTLTTIIKVLNIDLKQNLRIFRSII